MSDLISRKAVLKYINDHKEFTAYKEDGINKSTNNYVNSAMLNSFISSLPAAFDVDNVVEQLEDAMGFYKGFVDSANSEYKADRWTHKAETYGEAIEIVKGGGVDE